MQFVPVNLQSLSNRTIPILPGLMAPKKRVTFQGKPESFTQQDHKQARQAYELLGWLFTQSSRPNIPLSEAEFTVLDLEATDFDPNSPATELLEITAIKYRNGRETGKFSTLVKPQGDIPEIVQQMTGITPQMAHKGGISPTEALAGLAEFVGPKPILVAHKATYDIPLLRTKLEQHGLQHWKERFSLNRAICTLTLARVALPKLKNYPVEGSGIYGLKPVADALRIQMPGQAHRAENDVKTAAGILYALIREMEAHPDQIGRPISTLRDLFALQGIPVGRKDEFLPDPEQTSPQDILEIAAAKLRAARQFAETPASDQA